MKEVRPDGTRDPRGRGTLVRTGKPAAAPVTDAGAGKLAPATYFEPKQSGRRQPWRTDVPQRGTGHAVSGTPNTILAPSPIAHGNGDCERPEGASVRRDGALALNGPTYHDPDWPGIVDRLWP